MTVGEMGAQNPVKTPRKELFSCGVGHFGNDLVDAVLMSFGLIYYMKVAGLSGGRAGIILVSGQVATFIANPIFGYCCDRVDVPLLSRKLGRRKSWHLIGTILTSVSFVPAFSPCFACSKPSTRFVYFLFTFNLASFWFGAVGIAHSSIVPEIAKTQEESIIVNSIITGMAYSGGLYTYALVWALLEQSDNENLTPNDWEHFTKITAILAATGLIFVIIFHVWTTESRKKKRRRVSTAFNSTGLLAVSLIFHLGPSVTAEGNDSTGRKPSKLRKLSGYIMPFDADLNDGIPPRKVSKQRRVSSVSRASVTSIASSTETGPPCESGKKSDIPQTATRADVGVATELSTNEDVFQQEGKERIEVNGVQRAPENVPAGKEELLSVVQTCHVDLEENQQISMRTLLRDPGLYKATLIYLCGFGLENMTYSYLGLYLTDYLHFQKEAVAYFSLVFLVSAICGTVLAKQLIKAFGRAWTQVVESTMGLGAAVWLYFVTESNKQMAYGPIVLAGFAVSALVVIGRSELADFARDDTESAGFAYSFAAATEEILCGLLFLVIQQFYPSDTAPCVLCGEYIRFVYAVMIGSHALVSLVAVVIFNQANLIPFCHKAPVADRKNKIIYL